MSPLAELMDFISGAYKMERMEGNFDGEKKVGKDAGWQADGCSVYWFIRRLSHVPPD